MCHYEGPQSHLRGCECDCRVVGEGGFPVIPARCVADNTVRGLSTRGKCTSGVSFTPVHTYETCRKDASGPDSSDGVFFSKAQQSGRDPKVCSSVLLSQKFGDLFHGESTLNSSNV